IFFFSNNVSLPLNAHRSPADPTQYLFQYLGRPLANSSVTIVEPIIPNHPFVSSSAIDRTRVFPPGFVPFMIQDHLDHGASEELINPILTKGFIAKFYPP
ncbi:unnamed protein product, partial [Porites evermanni]